MSVQCEEALVGSRKYIIKGATKQTQPIIIMRSMLSERGYADWFCCQAQVRTRIKPDAQHSD